MQWLPDLTGLSTFVKPLVGAVSSGKQKELTASLHIPSMLLQSLKTLSLLIAFTVVGKLQIKSHCFLFFYECHHSKQHLLLPWQYWSQA